MSFGFSGHWNDAEFAETVVVPAIDATTGMAVPTVVVAEGEPLTLVPQTTFNADIEVQRFFGELRGFAVLRAAYTDERAQRFSGLVRFGDEATRLNLRLGVDAERWAVHLFANNLTDENDILIPLFFGDPGSVQPPRTVGVNFRFRP